MTTADLPNIPLETVQKREALRRSLLRPNAPALKDPRNAELAMPDVVLPHAKGRATVFPAPRAGYLIFAPEKRSGVGPHRALYLAESAPEPIKLGAGRSMFPFPHAWTEDTLYICSRRELYAVRFPSIEARLVQRVDTGQFDSVSANDDLYATLNSDEFTVRRVADDAVVERESACGGVVQFTSEGRFLFLSTMGHTWLYAVRTTDLRLVATRRRRVMYCWEEDGEIYLNAMIDDGVERRDQPIHSYRVGDLAALYPSDWD